MIVVLSRVAEWLCNRMMPFKLGPGGTDRLLKLSFSPEYRQWLACYDENGFYKEQIKHGNLPTRNFFSNLMNLMGINTILI